MCDIYCVICWFKFDMVWEGVMLDDLFIDVGFVLFIGFLLVYSVDGYFINFIVVDVFNGCVMIVIDYDGYFFVFVYGGLVCLLVLYLYFWKFVKWFIGL